MQPVQNFFLVGSRSETATVTDSGSQAVVQNGARNFRSRRITRAMVCSSTPPCTSTTRPTPISPRTPGGRRPTKTLCAQITSHPLPHPHNGPPTAISNGIASQVPWPQELWLVRLAWFSVSRRFVRFLFPGASRTA